ncbi:MAG: MBL fold metallo-hydrolase [Planctomycetota bacterium]|jgi:metal-dependent hydrolase (beta-lactamase superfamily II)
MANVTLTDVYDNVRFDNALPDVTWGFAAVIENVAGLTLFDTGGDGAALMSNLAALDFDPRKVRRVFLSHAHYDHTGGCKRSSRQTGKSRSSAVHRFPMRSKTSFRRWAVVSSASATRRR